MQKYSFSHAERYAVWLNHEKRCWLCKEPLRLVETTIDHVVPESLLAHEDRLTKVRDIYDLPASFAINGFENWLPCHAHCNQTKSDATFDFVAGYKLILDRLIRDADKVERSAKAVTRNISTDKLFAKIFTAIEQQRVSVQELVNLVGHIGGGTFQQDQPEQDAAEFIKLDSGYWIHKSEIVAHGECSCEQIACVDHNYKVMCVWNSALSDWVIGTRLYWKCYDEKITCPRCDQFHKRGWIGRLDHCGKPFSDQINRRDA